MVLKTTAGIAMVTLGTLTLFERWREADQATQALTLRHSREVAGVTTAAARFVYDVLGVYAGGRPGAAQSGVQTAASMAARFSKTAAEHEEAA